MAALKLFFFTVFLSVVLTGIRVDADTSLSDVDGKPRSDASDSVELEQLKSKIHSLGKWVLNFWVNIVEKPCEEVLRIFVGGCGLTSFFLDSFDGDSYVLKIEQSTSCEI